MSPEHVPMAVVDLEQEPELVFRVFGMSVTSVETKTKDDRDLV